MIRSSPLHISAKDELPVVQNPQCKIAEPDLGLAVILEVEGLLVVDRILAQSNRFDLVVKATTLFGMASGVV